MDTVLKKLRRDAAVIWGAALKAADAREAVRRHVHCAGDRLWFGDNCSDISKGRRVWVIGAGKASAAMALSIEEMLGDRISGGLIVTKYEHGLSLAHIDVMEAGHPIPDENGLRAASRLTELIRNSVQKEDLLLVLLSGGGSALLDMPAGKLSLADLKAVNQLLLACGANIQEFNAVRKHLSAVKGGQLARLAAGIETWTLVLSDVPGDTLDVIASGPTVPDHSTFADALAVLAKYGLTKQVPQAVLDHLQGGFQGLHPDTPKADHACFARQHHLIVGSNALACRAAQQAAEERGYRVHLRESVVVEDNRVYAREVMARAAEIAERLQSGENSVCFISGGEPTVQLRGHGKGGRNQDLVLNCVPCLAALPIPCVFACLGTDGTDGPTDAAGAIADNATLARHKACSQRSLESFIADNDAYPFFESLGDLIKTGPTGTNVMDIHLLLLSRSSSAFLSS